MNINKHGELVKNQTLAERYTDPTRIILNSVVVMVLLIVGLATDLGVGMAVGWMIGLPIGIYLGWLIEGSPKAITPENEYELY